MRTKLVLYVGGVGALAMGWGWILFQSDPVGASVNVSDVLLLCALAITAELLAYVLPRSAAGTMSFVPYLAAAFVLPGWQSVACVACTKIVAEFWARREPIKAVLNVSAHSLMPLIAISVFLGLGGVPLAGADQVKDLAHMTRVSGAQALLATLLALLVNNLVVNGAIALSSGRVLSEVLVANKQHTVGIELIAAPLVFIFGWVFAAFGAIAAATVWVPILALRQVHRTNLELAQTNEELLELMVKSIEARDAYTSGHSRRVQQFSTIIARALGLSERQVIQVGRAALLHDVGKIHEKYAGVLSKQDKLTPEEWAIIQEHPIDGANLVATMTRLRELVPSVRHHHENWDGTGYPDRIAGTAIPVAARIIRFADTIDAMTTDRPYRRPLSEAQVRAEVLRCRGTQFDPDIADRLLASPLWPTLFAPASNEQRIEPFVVVNGARARGRRLSLQRLSSGA
jgi:putative nucleotidyltransferase with HDIG domain